MTAYLLTFYGRTIGALGITTRHTTRVEAETVEEAQLKAYDTHEHIIGGARRVRAEPIESEQGSS